MNYRQSGFGTDGSIGKQLDDPPEGTSDMMAYSGC